MPELLRIAAGALAPLVIAYSLGSLCLSRTAVPHTIRLAAGTAIESAIIFLLLLTGRATPGAFAALGAAALLPLIWVRPRRYSDAAVEGLGTFERWLFPAVFAAYGALYTVHALAPEVEFDGFTYHLGLPAEYARLGAFPDRIGFFEMLPHGMEMLFTLAIAVGGLQAAKLCHFAYLVATPAVMLALGRRLAIPDRVAGAAAVFYICAPVVGVAGTSVHNDAPLVFFILTTAYLLLRWHQEGGERYLWPAGITAGFCYAVKLPGLLIPTMAVAVVALVARHWKHVAALGLPAAFMIAPWMLQAAILTGNPFAPLLNRWFPNPWFHIASEQVLVRRFESYSGFSYWHAPLELTLGWRLEGIFGPLFLAAPVALLAWRRKPGRLLLTASLLLVAPWIMNHGARFLMPAVAVFSLALAMALPRPVLLAAVLLHAVAGWPAVIPLYARPGSWQFKEFPWRAALRLETERAYVARVVPEYSVAEILERTGPSERTLSLTGTPRAYTTRDVLEHWHSANAERLLDTLKVAGMFTSDPFFDVPAEWPAQPLRALRIRVARDYPAEWCIHEVELYSGDKRIATRRGWTLSAWPNPWELPSAFDENRATRWRTWEPIRRGMFVEVEFDRPQVLSRVVLQSHTPVYHVPFEFYGRAEDGRWRFLGAEEAGRLRVREDLRRPAVRALRRAGFRYILAPTGFDGAGPLGRSMEDHLTGWGLELVASRRGLRLFRIP